MHLDVNPEREDQFVVFLEVLVFLEVFHGRLQLFPTGQGRTEGTEVPVFGLYFLAINDVLVVISHYQVSYYIALLIITNMKNIKQVFVLLQLVCLLYFLYLTPLLRSLTSSAHTPLVRNQAGEEASEETKPTEEQVNRELKENADRTIYTCIEQSNMKNYTLNSTNYDWVVTL